ATRQTQDKAMVKIRDILDKSNSTLLHIESQNNLNSAYANDSQQQTNVYNLHPESQLALVKIFDNFQRIMGKYDKLQIYSAHNDCLVYRQRLENLESSARKLEVLYATVTQMKLDMEMHEQQKPIDQD
ncbi:msd1, partial [Drosophila busckii]